MLGECARSRDTVEDPDSVGGKGMSVKIRLLLVDDHRIVRMGLKVVLECEPDLEVED